MNLPRVSSHLVLALLVGVIATPMGTRALFRSQDDEGVLFEEPSGQFERAVNDRERLRNQRKEYFEAIEVYRDLLHKGVTGLTKPDVNGPSTFDFYLDPLGRDVPTQEASEEEAIHESAPEEGASVPVKDLTQYPERIRNMLSWYDLLGTCPESLKKSFLVPGFYDLCVEYLEGREARAEKKVAEHTASLRGAAIPKSTLRERLQKLQEDLGGGSLRPLNLTKPSTRN